MSEVSEAAHSHDEMQWLYSRVADLEDEIALLTALRPSRESWGYLRKGNAYARPVEPKPRVDALDVSPEQSPHG